MNESPKWPTLEDRIKNKLNSTEEAIRQLKNTVEISPVAQEILDRAEQNKTIKKFTHKVYTKKILSKNTPESMLCGCIFFVSIMHNYGITRQDISIKCGTSIPTINKVYDRLLEFTHELI